MTIVTLHPVVAVSLNECVCRCVSEVRLVSVYTDEEGQGPVVLLPQRLSVLSVCVSPGRRGQACFHMTLKQERNVSRPRRVWSLLGWNERRHHNRLYVCI